MTLKESVIRGVAKVFWSPMARYTYKSKLGNFREKKDSNFYDCCIQVPNSPSYYFHEEWGPQNSTNKYWQGLQRDREANVTLWVGPFGPIQCTVVAASTTDTIKRTNVICLYFLVP